jgi:hypothetical protein
MKYLNIITLVLSFVAQSQDYATQEASSKIKNVTVFMSGAQIERTSSVNVKPGQTEILFKSLSPGIDPNSVRVTARGDFMIESVSFRLDYLSDVSLDKRSDSLEQRISQLESEIGEIYTRQDVLAEKESVLAVNKQLGGEGGSASISELQTAIDYYDQSLTKIFNEERELNKKLDQLKDQKGRLTAEIAQVSTKREIATGVIAVRVTSNSASATKTNFELNYFVSEASWLPKYDIRADQVGKPLALSYKASIFQNTGVDWENVDLKLSNGNPTRGQDAPQLSKWKLNYPRNTIYWGSRVQTINRVTGTVYSASDGSPIPGVNVVAQGTTVGTTTDIDGNYSIAIPKSAKFLVFSFIGLKNTIVPINQSSMDIRMEEDFETLAEVVVTGASARKQKMREQEQKAAILPTSVVENQTTVEFQVDKPYSVKSGGLRMLVDLKKYEIPCEYEYYTVPKVDQSAYLVAKISDWNQYRLMQGEANLFFENSFVGTTILDNNPFDDTLQISLGRDNSISISREVTSESSRRQSIGNNATETREIEIVVRNNKSSAITLSIQDQIPVPALEEIAISPTKTDGGTLDTDSGFITWQVTLKADQQQKLNFGYEVKYPKKERVILE